MRGNQPRLLAIGAVVLAMGLTACGGGTAPDESVQATQSGQASTNANADKGGGPTFTGAWAGPMREQYKAATSDLERNALSDGKITEAEVKEVQGKFVECMRSRNHEVTWEADRDSYSITYGTTEPSDEQVEAEGADIQDCEAQTGVRIVSLFYQMKGNPNNEDFPTIMAACLVRAGLVPKDYGANDYKRDYSADPQPSFFEDPKALTCNSNPAGT